MVSRFSNGGNPGAIDEGVRKKIQSLKEVVGSHSDADIYAALKEANMDADETAQKLLNQDPFREVRRKRDKKKEVEALNDDADGRKQSTNIGQVMKFHALPNRNLQKLQRGVYSVNSGPRNSFARGFVRRRSVVRKSTPGINREFRVVRDNRPINADGKSKTQLLQSSASKSDKSAADVNGNGQTGKTPSGASNKKEVVEENRNAASSVVPELHSAVTSSASLASSTDPVHVPSPDSRSFSAIGAIKREFRKVDLDPKFSENAVNDSSVRNGTTLSNSFSRKDGNSLPYRPFSPSIRADRNTQTTPESLMANAPVGRSSFTTQHSNRNNHYGNRMQQVAGHQKATSQNKEWKPKSSQKSGVRSPGIIGTPKRSSPSPNQHMDLKSEAAKLEDKLSSVNISESQNVIIADHIRVPATDRFRLTFGSFAPEFNSSTMTVSGVQEANMLEEADPKSAPSLSVPVPAPSIDVDAVGKPVDVVDDQVRRTESDPQPEVSVVSDQRLTETRDSVQNADDYANIGLIQGSNPSYVPSESTQQQDPTGLRSFSEYDLQNGYDIPYFRPTIDEAVRAQGLPSPQEALNSHTNNSIPASTIAMLQQQQQQQAPMAQMYPQVHVSHFPNLMQYRQFVSPVYMPQMPMPGYSGNPTFPPHPSNGNNYMLMPGGSSHHLNASGLKYGIQQFKPVPTATPSGFGNYSNPACYPINSPGVVGGATGLEDSSRIKYKDGNMYVSNQQAETSEMWIQNPRDLSSLQSAQYYNMAGQTPHGAYLTSHTGHASFNAQSSHMQFQGLFHAPQPSAMAVPHHMGPTLSGNLGVAPPAPPAQVGTYQQPQLGHLNWPANF